MDHLHAALGRRSREHGVPPVVGAQRPPPLRLEAAQVLGARRMAAGIEHLEERLRRRPFVEPLATIARDAPQRRRQRRVAQHLPRLQRLPAGEHQRIRLGERLHALLGARDEAGENLADREPLLGEFDGRRHHGRQGELPVLLVEREQACHFAWNRHTPQVARLPWFLAGHLGNGSGGRSRGRRGDGRFGVAAPGIGWLRRIEVQEDDLLLALEPDVGDSAPAQAGHLRLDHADRERRGDGRINGVAAGTQHGHAGLAREAVRRRHDAVRAFDTVLRVGGRGTRGGRRRSGQLRGERHDRRRADRGEP